MIWLFPDDGFPIIKQANEGSSMFYVPGVRVIPSVYGLGALILSTDMRCYCVVSSYF